MHMLRTWICTPMIPFWSDFGINLQLVYKQRPRIEPETRNLKSKMESIGIESETRIRERKLEELAKLVTLT